MHIEKNVFENIFNTVMDVKGKTKDNINARMDITLFFVTVKIWSWFMLVHRSQSPKPTPPYTRMHSYLSANDLKVCVFLMDMPRTYQGW